ncbi:amidohydrolase family protein [Phreatobacter sp. AB_2022a]|uniref:amidohydrolase family protein n=1 Tax=Phreatobacter sp. AB_2022a TaxID=3003134 RepID=UPI0022871CF2|nr:amidohydrolase family protein [Phreatobacter sp. AB_2022a]MCZ0737118.1 amidohydrolase family protein [Phreatobacter sp. AB_2022a]
MAETLMIRNARPYGGASADILIRDGRIAAVAPPGLAAEGQEIDAGGALALPGFVEAHTHLDKTLWGMGWHPHSAGPGIADKIDNERRVRREIGIEPDRQATRLAAQMLAMGTTHIRSHVDIDTEVGLAGIEGVMAMRERLKPVVDVEIVAFPQSGLMIRPGTLELVDRALALGAEVVGGLDPCAIDRDPKGHLDAVFGLAEKHGRPIDIHLHERGEMGAFSLDMIIERTRALGMQGRVTVSHAFCLGMPDIDHVRRLIADLARERIALATTAPASAPAPAVRTCLEAGVVVCGGSDGVRDSWNPYGIGDMLERAMLVGLRNDFRRDEDIALAVDVCTHGGAKVMGLADYGLEAGCAADLVLVAGESLAEAVAVRPRERTVIKRGRLVVRDGRLAVPIA